MAKHKKVPKGYDALLAGKALERAEIIAMLREFDPLRICMDWELGDSDYIANNVVVEIIRMIRKRNRQ